MSKKRNKTIKIVVLILVALLVFVLFFPLKLYLKDGGTVEYVGCLGATYSVSKLHRLSNDPDGNACYEVGTVIKVFGIEVYNDSYIDYDHPVKTIDEIDVDFPV